jgi:hypothetical protein
MKDIFKLIIEKVDYKIGDDGGQRLEKFPITKYL